MTERKSCVLKAAEVRPMEGAKLRPFHVGDLMGEAREILAAARSRSDQMLAEVRTQVETIRQTAWEEGRKSGHEQGLEEGRKQGYEAAFAEAGREFEQQQQSLVQSFRQAVQTIEDERRTWAASARQDLIDLAVAIARRVARHVGQRERDVVLANLDEAIQLAGERSRVTLVVNPVDEETTRRFAQSLIEARERWEHVEVVVEKSLAPGGCRVQWHSGSADARLDTQLDRIAAELGAFNEPGRREAEQSSEA